jgi:hypothetical protein
MARGCTIPCDIGGVERRIRMRAVQDTLPAQGPALGAAVLFLVLSPILIPIAGWPAALVTALFFLLGIGVVVGRSMVEASGFTKLGVPAELDRIIDEHEAELFAPRVAELRAQAARLTYDSEAYRKRVGQFLQELRMTTGEAWRCPCRKRRLPIPLPF